jgi:hypothetical protein
MKRRDFITLLGGAAMAWPLVARAQQPERMRRIGVLINTADNDPDAVARLSAFKLSAFKKALRELGWDEGRNLQIDTRLGVDDDRMNQSVLKSSGRTRAFRLQTPRRMPSLPFCRSTRRLI